MTTSTINLTVTDSSGGEDEDDFAGDEVDDPNYIPPKALSNSQIIPHIAIGWIPFRGLKEEKYGFRQRQILKRSRECTRALDVLEALNAGYEIQNILDPLLDPSEFEALLNLDQALIMGHSFGAATALVALSTELRFKLGICLDIWTFPVSRESLDLVPQPIIFINSENYQSHENLKIIKYLLKTSQNYGKRKIRPKPTGIRAILGLTSKPRVFAGTSLDNPDEDSNQNFERKVVAIKGTVHYNQSDFPFVLNWFGKLWLGVNSWRNKFTAHDLTIALSLDFISKHLDIPVSDERKLYLNLKSNKLKFGIKV